MALGFDTLLPEQILSAIEQAGFRCTGELLALNSYENRVYRAALDSGERVVAKFYRPGRWSNAAIEEEHDYATRLRAADLDIVAPLVFDGASLLHIDGFRLAIYPCVGGRWPALEDEELLRQVGRLVARMHLSTGDMKFHHRPAIDVTRFGWEARDAVLNSEFIPEALEAAYESVTDDLLDQVESELSQVSAQHLAIHNDLHPGNLLQDGPVLHVVDTDDAANGPAVQDLWMLLSGPREQQAQQLDTVLDGYQQFRDFDFSELALIEPLRTLRIVHYAAWLARRWHDPAFQQAFPWFDGARYWNEHILALREQQDAMRTPFQLSASGYPA
ncbi:MAG: serine/threonine protein kinase [Pseudomonadota bacterium]